MAGIESYYNYLPASSDSSNLERSEDDSDDKEDLSTEQLFSTWNNEKTVMFGLTIGNYVHFTEKKPNVDILTDELIEHCSNAITATVKPGCHTITSCNLSKQGLKSIEIMKYHKYITHLDLSKNYLSQLNAIGFLPFLTYLNVSQNLLSKLLDFTPPLNLRYVNFSYNLIEYMPDLTDFWALEYLDVSHNLLHEIQGLTNLSLLQYLDLSYNYIRKIKGLNNLNIKHLLLDHNEIDTPDCNHCDCPLSSLERCTSISMSCNKITTMKAFAGMSKLEKLNLAHNLINTLADVGYLQRNTRLVYIDLRNNSIQSHELYLDTIIYFAKNIQYLDGNKIDNLTKGSVMFKYSTNCEVMARNANATLHLLSSLSNPVINENIPSNFHQTAPIIVLVGPTASRKRRLAKMIQSVYYRKRIILGVTHTTRARTLHEVDKVDYYFTTRQEFHNLLEDGKLVTCVKKYGQFFGISDAEIQRAKNAHAIIFTTDLDAAFQLKERYAYCKLIFSIPKSELSHLKWLAEHFHANPWLSTYITAYTIAYQATRHECLKDIKKKNRICASILEEIINYIERIHERKEYLEDDGYTYKDANNDLIDNNSTGVSFVKSSKSSSRRGTFQSVSETNLDDNYNDMKSQNTVNTIKSIKVEPIDTITKIHYLQPTLWLNAPNVTDNPHITNNICDTLFNAASNTSMQTPLLTTSHTTIDCTINSSEEKIDENPENDAENVEEQEKTEEVDNQLKCLQLFLNDQKAMRDIYINAFHDHPGLCFYKVVYTDILEEAVELVHEIILLCIQGQERRSKQWKQNLDNLKYDKIIQSRIDYCLRKCT